jgi:hypothetical protein
MAVDNVLSKERGRSVVEVPRTIGPFVGPASGRPSSDGGVNFLGTSGRFPWIGDEGYA